MEVDCAVWFNIFHVFIHINRYSWKFWKTVEHLGARSRSIENIKKSSFLDSSICIS